MTTPRAERLPHLAVLFPVRAWLRHPALGAGTTWAFVALVAVPPAALALFPWATRGSGSPLPRWVASRRSFVAEFRRCAQELLTGPDPGSADG